MMKTLLYRFTVWGTKPIYNRYIHLMVRDRNGLERWERNRLLKHRKLTGRFCDWILGIK